MKKKQQIEIGKRKIGPGFPTYVIFEVASTHEKDWEIARAYVEQAKKAGADALKFQLFEADKLFNPITSGLKGTYDFFKSAETPREWFPRLKKLCDKKGVDLLCTPFDEDVASFLNDTGIPAIKIASGELTNHQLLSHVAKLNKPVILSTGMATMDEIRKVVKGFQINGCEELALLQCVSLYPMSYEDANIRAMQTLQEEFGCVVGYSDNGSKGHLVPLLAVALGASIIEKHVTSQKKRGNLDDIFSLSVEEFAEMVKRIRSIEKRKDQENILNELKGEFGDDFTKALGNGIKRPAKHGILRADGVHMTETAERHWARRGIYPNVNIPKGITITADMMSSLRPDVGISAVDFEKVIGKVASEDIEAFTPIKLVRRSIMKFKKEDIKRTYNRVGEEEFAKILFESGKF